MATTTATTTTTTAPLSRSSSTSSFLSAASTSSRKSHQQQRPWHSRSTSRDSSSRGGWYAEDQPTLDDFAQRLETAARKFENWQGRCAHNLVMGLLGPAPITLFLFSPIWVVLMLCVLLVWGVGKYVAG